MVNQPPVTAKPHTPVYLIHKFWSRRPWNLFRYLIERYSKPNEVVLDVFCGGGVSVVESLITKRSPIGIDINRLATYVTKMEAKYVNIKNLQAEYKKIKDDVAQTIKSFYKTWCPACGQAAAADWFEWKNGHIVSRFVVCPSCKFKGRSAPSPSDPNIAKETEGLLEKEIKQQKTWVPDIEIPVDKKTKDVLKRGHSKFSELFTPRNLLALAVLRKRILEVKDKNCRDFLLLAFSSSLKWSSIMSHIRTSKGKDIVEGMALHAYWVYPRQLEINVWSTFERRVKALIRGKEYSNRHIGACKVSSKIDCLFDGRADCIVQTKSSEDLSDIPSNSVDFVLTDPPWGYEDIAVNYTSLSNYWIAWLWPEAVVRKPTERKSKEQQLSEYKNMLQRCFSECWRVLKPNKRMAVTFNTRHKAVLDAFLAAVSAAGFEYIPEESFYSPPVKAYITTVHAIRKGAKIGDYVFLFRKSPL